MLLLGASLITFPSLWTPVILGILAKHLSTPCTQRKGRDIQKESKNAVSSYHIMRPRDDVSDRPRSPSPYSRQIGGLEKRLQPEKASFRRDATTPATATPAHEVTGAAYVPPAYNQYPPIYPPFPQNYPAQYQYPFPAYPYPLHYPYPPHPSMIQHPTNDKGQKPTGYQSWAGHGKTTGGATPPRSTSPNPPGKLNSQPTRRPDAATSQASPRERPKFVHFRENSVGSYEQDALKKTHE